MTDVIDWKNSGPYGNPAPTTDFAGHGILDVPLVVPSSGQKIPPRGFALVGMTHLADLQKSGPYGNPAPTTDFVGHGILDVPLVAPSKDKKIPPRGFALVGMTRLVDYAKTPTPFGVGVIFISDVFPALRKRGW